MPEAFDLKRMRGHTWVRLIFNVMDYETRNVYFFSSFSDFTLSLFLCRFSFNFYSNYGGVNLLKGR